MESDKICQYLRIRMVNLNFHTRRPFIRRCLRLDMVGIYETKANIMYDICNTAQNSMHVPNLEKLSEKQKCVNNINVISPCFINLSSVERFNTIMNFVICIETVTK